MAGALLDSAQKKCSSCAQVLLRSMFHKRIASQDQLAFICKECNRKKAKFWYEKNKVRGLLSRADWRNKNKSKMQQYSSAWYKHDPNRQRDLVLKRQYGISLAEFRAIYDAADGKCDICGVKTRFDGRSGRDKAVVDHCHTTKKCRGMICAQCNSGLGFFRDSPASIRAAAAYIERWLRLHQEAA